jgi:hypothetical protein
MILEAARSNDRQARGDWGITNDIRADPRDFTDAYVLVENDMVAYGSGAWVCMHDTWVLREGHGTIHILLTGRMIRVC